MNMRMKQVLIEVTADQPLLAGRLVQETLPVLDLREYCGWEHRPLRRAFEQLLDMEYIHRVYGTDNIRSYYKLSDHTEQSNKLRINLWK